MWPRHIPRTSQERYAYRLITGVDRVRAPLLPSRRKHAKVPKSLKAWVGFTVILAANEIEERYARQVSQLGISLRDFVLLAEIAQRPGITQGALAERLGLSRSRVSEQLAVLSTAGYVEREMDQDDLRCRRLWVTRGTYNILEEAKVAISRVDKQWQSPLSPGERPAFRSMLRRLPPEVRWPG
jgi:DNA-binding MarR family transcriptional regulator